MIYFPRSQHDGNGNDGSPGSNMPSKVISYVVAVAEDGAIGRANGLPWHLPNDFRFFKQITIGKPVIMGRRTWESLGGKPLPHRVNVVISSHDRELPEGVLLFKDVDRALEYFKDKPEVCIIGGAGLFESTLSEVNVLHLTRVHTTVPDADTYFPSINWIDWKLMWKEDHASDDRHKYDYTFQMWQRIK